MSRAAHHRKWTTRTRRRQPRRSRKKESTKGHRTMNPAVNPLQSFHPNSSSDSNWGLALPLDYLPFSNHTVFFSPSHNFLIRILLKPKHNNHQQCHKSLLANKIVSFTCTDPVKIQNVSHLPVTTLSILLLPATTSILDLTESCENKENSRSNLFPLRKLPQLNISRTFLPILAPIHQLFTQKFLSWLFFHKFDLAPLRINCC